MRPMHNFKLSQHPNAQNSTVNGGNMESNEEIPKPSPLKRPRIEINVRHRNNAAWNKHYPPQFKVLQRANIQVKPANTTENDSSGMSQTSKRIFAALEHFATPISNAEEISLQRQKTSSGSSFVTRKRLGGDAKSRVGLRYLTREISVPTVPEMLKLMRVQKLQHTTMAAREIASASNFPPPDPQTYRLGFEINKNSKYCGKIKTKLKATIEERGTVQNVNLPDIALPLSSLSNNIMFDLKFPEFQKAKDQKNYFKFSSPIKLTNPQQIKQSNYTFKFRTALNVENQPQMLNKSSSISFNVSTFSPPSNFIWTNTSSSVTLKEKESNAKEPSIGVRTIELKTGSVIDFFNSWNKETTDKSNSEKNENNHKEPNLADTDNSDNNNNHSYCTEDRQIDLGCQSCDKMKTKVNKSELESTMSIVELSNSNIMGKLTPNHLKTGLNKSCSVNMNIISSFEGRNDTGEITVPISTPSAGTISSEKSKSNKTQWKCPSCMIESDYDANAGCPCCKILKTVDSIYESKKIESAPSKGLLEKLKKLEGACSIVKPGTEESKSTLSLGIPEPSPEKASFSLGIQNKNSSEIHFTQINSNPSSSPQKSLFVFGKIANTTSTGNVEFRDGAFNDPPSNSFNFAFNMPNTKQPKVATPIAIDTVFGIPRKVALGNQATSSFSSTSGINDAGFTFSTLSQSASRNFQVEPMEIASSVPFDSDTAYICNSNDKPSVNITDGEGQTTLNASLQKTQQRRIIKAVRRRRDGQR